MGLNGLKGLMGLDGFKVIAERDYEATGFMGSMLRVQGLRRSSVSVISGFTLQGIEGFQGCKWESKIYEHRILNIEYRI